MTVLQFQELYYIAKNEPDELDKSVKMVACVTGQTPDAIDTMPMDKFNTICGKINKSFELLGKKLITTKPVSFVTANGTKYRIHYDVSKQPNNAAKYVEVITFQKDIVANIHKIMASIVEPVRWTLRKMKYEPFIKFHGDIATDMEQLDFEVAYHCAVFFCTLYSVSMECTLPYLIRAAVAKGMKAEEVEDTLRTSLKILDGFIMPKWSVNLRGYLLNRFGTWV